MVKIWGRTNSINVQKVLWCATEIGLAYERIDLGGSFGGTHDPAYLALNPNALVPTLEEDGFVLWESNTIVRYLASRWASGSLWPTDPRVRGEAERWMDWQLSTLNADMVTVFWGLVRTPPEKRDPAAIEAARKSLCDIWGRLDRHLADRPFVAGDAFTMGDIPAGCLAYRWFNLPIPRNDLRHLRSWYDRLAARPAYKKHVMTAMI